jgi:pSer/pThr/pTyr-binding forkhead associated (FHA) protein
MGLTGLDSYRRNVVGMNPGDAGRQPGTARRQATVLESVEEIRAQIRGMTGHKEPIDVPVAAPAAGAEQDTTAYRPTLRPSMALLHVLDDGEDSGEILRIRPNSFVIGRVEGNLTVPHDGGISGRHAEISRRYENGEHCWYLKDLQSTNGTFVRASTVVLSHEQEFLLGSRRFRYEVPAVPEQAAAVEPAINATRKWESLAGSSAVSGLQPALVDVSPGRPGQRFPLREQEHWLGRDPTQCSIVVDDPMVNRRHARVYRDEKNRWIVANARSRNGLWARIQDVSLGRGAYFQCGEQRFFFKVL